MTPGAHLADWVDRGSAFLEKKKKKKNENENMAELFILHNW